MKQKKLIALILSLSNGFDIEIDNFEKDTLSSMPVIVSEQAMQMDEETLNKIHNEESLKLLISLANEYKEMFNLFEAEQYD